MSCKRISRLTALLLVFAVLCAALAGCSGKTETDTRQPETSVAPEETPENEASENEAPENEAPPTEPGSTEAEASAEPEEETGPLVKYPVADDVVTLSCFYNMFDNLNSMIDSYADMPVMKETETKNGIHIEWVSPGMSTVVEQLNLMVAGGELTDIICGVGVYYTGGTTAAYSDEIIIPLNDYVDEYLADYWAVVEDKGLSSACCDDEGNIFGIAAIVEKWIQSEGYLIRTDWLEEAGMDVPETLEDWDRVLKAFKVNHPEASDVLLMNSNCSDFANLWNVSALRVTNSSRQDATSHLYQEDGTVKIAMLQERYHDYIRTLADWYDQGIIGSDFFSRSENANDSAYTACILNGESGIFRTNGLSFLVRTLPEDFAMTGIPFPTDPYGNENHFFTTDTSTDSMTASVCVSTSCQQPEYAVAWMNYWYTDEGYMYSNYGVEGVTYELVDDQVELTEFYFDDPTAPLYTMLYFPHYTDNYTAAVAEATELSLSIMNIWHGSLSEGSSWDLPGVSLSQEESEVVNYYNTDVLTITGEYVIRFITGEYDVENDWSRFTDLLLENGAEDIRAAYQSALDRYNNR